MTFETIEAQGTEALLEQLRDELTGRTYQPLPARRQEIPKDGGKVRVLSIPAIRDRVVQGDGRAQASDHSEIDGARPGGRTSRASEPPRPARPRGRAQTHTRTCLRGGLPTGIVWISAQADGP